MRLAPLALIAALALMVAPATTSARPDPRLWATVNICDTPAAPDSMGVRGGMPGDRSRDRMYVRFIAQFYSHSSGRWFTTEGSGRSPWLYVGRSRRRSLQTGWTFPFAPPPQGRVFRVRALAVFEWRRRKRVGRDRDTREIVSKRRKRITRSGVRGADGGDPAGTSRASCDIV